MDTERIWKSVRKASLLKCISYSFGRLSRKQIAKTVPEISRFFKAFGPGSLQDWNDEMQHHNALLRREASIGVARLMHCSLDMYMLHVRSDAVAEVLECLLAFGRRMIPLIRRHPESEDWPLSAEISVQRRHWYKLSLQVMNLVHLLGIQQVDHAGKSQPPIPFCEDAKLFEAVNGLQDMFGEFAEADCLQPSLVQLYAHTAAEPSNLKESLR